MYAMNTVFSTARAYKIFGHNGLDAVGAADGIATKSAPTRANVLTTSGKNVSYHICAPILNSPNSIRSGTENGPGLKYLCSSNTPNVGK